MNSNLAIREDKTPPLIAIPRVALELGVAAIVAFSVATGFPAQAAVTEHAVSFQDEVLPIFETKCIGCHSEGGIADIEHGVILTSYKGLMAKSGRGFAVVPFHSDRSRMMRILVDNWSSENKDMLKMPPLGPKLSPKEIKTISDWIDQGAKNN